MANAPALEAHITEWTLQLTAAQLLEQLHAIGVPSAKVARVSDVIENPQLAHRGQILAMPHAKAGTVPMQGFSVQFGASPMRLNHPPPTLGQHTEEVLREWLALEPERIAELRDNRVV